VPEGVILPTDAYRAWMAPHRDEITARLAAHDTPQAKSAAVVEYLQQQPLPDDLATALAALPPHDYAVRSSGSAEDLPGAAFAGLHDTLLNVHGADALLAAVKQCWLSLWNAEVLPYRERLGVAHDSAAMAVVIQQMVDVQADEAAGVAFSVDPVRGDLGNVLINAAFGLGETVVAGESPVDEFRVDRADALTMQQIATKPQALGRVEPQGWLELLGLVPIPSATGEWGRRMRAQVGRHRAAGCLRLGVRAASPLRRRRVRVSGRTGRIPG